MSEEEFIDSMKCGLGKSPLESEQEEEEKKNNETKDQTDAKSFGISRFFRSKKHDDSVYVMPTPRDAEEYNMNLGKRGMALLFNQTKFDARTGMRTREGSDVDRKSLKDTMIHLGFNEEDILVYEDLSVLEIRQALKKVAELDHTDHDCLTVAICTHGTQPGTVYARDAAFLTEQLWEPFAGHKCITLVGKPKIFFIQACQGAKVDPGVGVDSDDVVDRATAYYKIPSFADMLIYYSTMPGYYSWRSPVNGSWFVESLCRILKTQSHELDLISLLTLVNQRVAYNYMSQVPGNTEKDEAKQMPCITSMLTRKVVFRPKLEIPQKHMSEEKK